MLSSETMVWPSFDETSDVFLGAPLIIGMSEDSRTVSGTRLPCPLFCVVFFALVLYTSMAETTPVTSNRIDNTARLFDLRVDSMAVVFLRNHLSADAEIQAPGDAIKGASETP